MRMNNEEKILSMLETIVVKVDKLEAGQAKLEEGQTKLEKRLSKVEEDVTFTREKATLMEIEHGNQLKGLLDGHMNLKHTLDEHTKALDRMERKIDNLDTIVGVHDVKLKASNA